MIWGQIKTMLNKYGYTYFIFNMFWISFVLTIGLYEGLIFLNELTSNGVVK